MNHFGSRAFIARSSGKALAMFGLLAVLTLLAPLAVLARLLVYAGLAIAVFFGLFGPSSFPLGTVIGITAVTWFATVLYDLLYDYVARLDR